MLEFVCWEIHVFGSVRELTCSDLQIKSLLPKHGYALGTIKQVGQDAYDLSKGVMV